MALKNFKHGVSAVFLGILAYSFAPVLIRITLSEGVNAEWIAAMRLLISTALLAPVVLSRTQTRIQFKNLQRKDLIVSLFGAIALSVHFVTWVLALKHTTALASTALICVQIIFGALLSGILLKEKQSWALGVGVIPVVVGSLMISGADLSRLGNSTGAIYAMISALSIALYYIAGRIARRNLSLNAYTLIVYGAGAVFLALYALIFAPSLPALSLKSLLAIVGLVVVSTFLGHSVINWSLKYVEVVYVSMMTLLQPVFTLTWAVLFFDEYPSLEVYLGTFMILIGLGLYLFLQRRKSKAIESSI